MLMHFVCNFNDVAIYARVGDGEYYLNIVLGPLLLICFTPCYHIEVNIVCLDRISLPLEQTKIFISCEVMGNQFYFNVT
jgi:hypothetical protein